MNWIDRQLVSPIRVVELTRIYDGLIDTLSKAQTFDGTKAGMYSSLWLTCSLLEHAKGLLLSNDQIKSVRETKDRCLLVLEVFDLYAANTPLDVLSSADDSLVVVMDETQEGMLSWKFEQTINFDKDTLAQEETMLVEMANTHIPEKNVADNVNDSMEGQWHHLQERVRQVWGESEYQKAVAYSVHGS